MTAKISVGTSAFTMGAYAQKPIPFEKVVARLGELGYDGLELPANKGYGSLEDWPYPASRKKLVQLVRGAGLEISSYGADLSPSPYYSNDPAVGAGAQTLFERSIEFCLDCEIEVIRVDTLSEPPGPPGVSYEDAWRARAGRWTSCAISPNRAWDWVVRPIHPGRTPGINWTRPFAFTTKSDAWEQTWASRSTFIPILTTVPC
jgi:sugar phosphate isomerase/epimerase